MKAFVFAIGLSILPASGYAQSCCITTLNNCTSCGTFILSGSGDSANCAGNDKTAKETSQCKLDYWRKEVTRRQKARDEAQSDLDKALDRIKAFESDR